MWKHGNEKILKKVIEMSLEKKEKAYANFEIRTNFKIRSKAFMAIKDDPFIVKSKRKSFLRFLIEFSSYKYCITPQGSGYDTHRLWECLYLNTIPIIDVKKLFKTFRSGIWEGTPIIYIDDWKNFSKDLIIKKKII